jgi:hypothetical protein
LFFCGEVLDVDATTAVIILQIRLVERALAGDKYKNNGEEYERAPEYCNRRPGGPRENPHWPKALQSGLDIRYLDTVSIVPGQWPFCAPKRLWTVKDEAGLRGILGDADNPGRSLRSAASAFCSAART